MAGKPLDYTPSIDALIHLSKCRALTAAEADKLRWLRLRQRKQAVDRAYRQRHAAEIERKRLEFQSVNAERVRAQRVQAQRDYARRNRAKLSLGNRIYRAKQALAS